MTDGSGILLSVQQRVPRDASSRFDMQSVNLVQMQPSGVSRVKLFSRLGRPTAASVRLTSTRPRCRFCLPNCHQHLGAGRHAVRTPIGGDMQRR